MKPANLFIVRQISKTVAFQRFRPLVCFAAQVGSLQRIMRAKLGIHIVNVSSLAEATSSVSGHCPLYPIAFIVLLYLI